MPMHPVETHAQLAALHRVGGMREIPASLMRSSTWNLLGL
jgi:hypothetical protein